jgi:hypothetical protein
MLWCTSTTATELMMASLLACVLGSMAAMECRLLRAGWSDVFAMVCERETAPVDVVPAARYIFVCGKRREPND